MQQPPNKQHFVKQPTPVWSRHLENATVSKKMMHWYLSLPTCMRPLPQLKTWLFPVLFSKIMIWSLIFYHNFDHWSWFDLYDCGAHIYDYSNPFIIEKKPCQQIYHIVKSHTLWIHICVCPCEFESTSKQPCVSLLLPWWPSDMNVC